MRSLRSDIREDRNHTHAAERTERHDLIVISGIDIDLSVRKIRKMRDRAEVPARLFDRTDIGVLLRDPDHRLRLDRRAGPRRNIVDDARELRSGSDRRIVIHQSILRRLIIVGRDEQQTVRAELFSFLAHHDRVSRIVRARPGNDRDPSADDIDGELYDFQMFVILKCRRFAGSPDADDRIRMIFDLILEKGFERVVIHFPILLHRRDKGNTGTSED